MYTNLQDNTKQEKSTEKVFRNISLHHMTVILLMIEKKDQEHLPY